MFAAVGAKELRERFEPAIADSKQLKAPAAERRH
jgi:hypothetical protein